MGLKCSLYLTVEVLLRRAVGLGDTGRVVLGHGPGEGGGEGGVEVVEAVDDEDGVGGHDAEGDEEVAEAHPGQPRHHGPHTHTPAAAELAWRREGMDLGRAFVSRFIDINNWIIQKIYF